MLRAILKVLILVGLFGTPTVGLTKVKVRGKNIRGTAQHQAFGLQKGVWSKGVNTVVQMNGLGQQEASQCKVFNVRVDDSLRFNIECNGESKAEKLNLKNSNKYTVTHHRNQMTITKFNFLMKKPQTSRLEQASLKIPYVEEIIHLKRQESGELAFYLEKFKVDEFGRIVQDSIIQVHGLLNKNLKVSVNK